MESVEPAKHRVRNALEIRRMNLQAALNVLRDGRSRTSPELGEALDVKPPTISRLMECLANAGVVNADGWSTTQSVGRPPRMWALNSGAGYAIGFSVRPRHISAVLVDLTGAIQGARYEACPGAPTTTWLGDAVSRMSTELASGVPGDLVVGVGIATPGIVDPRSGSIRVSEFLLADTDHRARDYCIREDLAGRLPWAIHVSNDANVGAFALFRHMVSSGGLAVGASLMYLMASDDLRGLGSGLVVQGSPHTGSTGGAGEILYPHTPGGGKEPRDIADRIARIEPLAVREVVQELEPALRYVASAALLLDLDAVVLGGYLVGLGPDAVAAFTRAVQECLRGPGYLDGIMKPQVCLDPMWPRTMELGAAGLVLEQLFGAPVLGAPSPLVRKAMDAGGVPG